MDMISFREEILQLIAFRQEGEYWDFKKEWHKNKSDLLHDIICMANKMCIRDRSKPVKVSTLFRFRDYGFWKNA